VKVVDDWRFLMNSELQSWESKPLWEDHAEHVSWEYETMPIVIPNGY
jgi:hypothetical protein